MNRRKLSHVIAAGILAALLALPGPALAQGTHSRGAAGILEWLAGLWERTMAAQGAWVGPLQKAGPGIDPNGGKPAGTGGTTGSTGGTVTGSGVQGDQGLGIDPHG